MCRATCKEVKNVFGTETGWSVWLEVSFKVGFEIEVWNSMKPFHWMEGEWSQEQNSKRKSTLVVLYYFDFIKKHWTPLSPKITRRKREWDFVELILEFRFITTLQRQKLSCLQQNGTKIPVHTLVSLRNLWLKMDLTIYKVISKKW